MSKFEFKFNSFKELNIFEDRIYMEKILKNFLGKEVNGFSFDYDNMAGYFFWSKGDKCVAATPYWEERDGICINVYEDDGVVDPTIIENFETTYSSRTDWNNYLEIVGKYLV